MTPEEINNMIQAGLPGALAQIRSDDHHHFEGEVIAADFAGKNRVQRQRLVYATLGSLVGNEIHALSFSAFTPEEWAEKNPG